MEKGIGFNRNILLEWLNATAAIMAETDDLEVVRQRLAVIIEQVIDSPTNIRKTSAILLNIWSPEDESLHKLRVEGLTLFQSVTPAERVWLHYGMSMAVYPFFFQAVTAVGQLSRFEDTIKPLALRQKLFAELGELGSIKKAADRVVYSLRDWGILTDAEVRNEYVPQYRAFATENPALESWLLSAALKAHPADELPFADLLQLPALFPFKFSVTVYDLRQSGGFEVQRQGLGLDMVRTI